MWLESGTGEPEPMEIALSSSRASLYQCPPAIGACVWACEGAAEPNCFALEAEDAACAANPGVGSEMSLRTMVCLVLLVLLLLLLLVNKAVNLLIVAPEVPATGSSDWDCAATGID